MPIEERPSKNKKEDPSKETEEPEGPKEEGAQRNGGTNGHGKGKTISQDFKERWDKAEGDERPDEKKAQPEQPKYACAKKMPSIHGESIPFDE